MRKVIYFYRLKSRDNATRELLPSFGVAEIHLPPGGRLISSSVSLRYSKGERHNKARPSGELRDSGERGIFNFQLSIFHFAFTRQRRGFAFATRHTLVCLVAPLFTFHFIYDKIGYKYS